MKTIITLLAMLALAGCATPVPQQRYQANSAPFDAAALKPYAQTGTARIYGQAFLMTRGGDVKLGAGQTVTCTPATAFIKEARLLRDQGIEPISVTDDVSRQIKAAVRSTLVDAQGNYELRDLPAGEYLLEVKIKWSTGYTMTGGFVRKYVHIDEGAALKVILTDS